MGQYLKIPPRVMFLTQVWGTILGVCCTFRLLIYIYERYVRRYRQLW
jgi:hypothetical protein